MQVYVVYLISHDEAVIKGVRSTKEAAEKLALAQDTAGDWYDVVCEVWTVDGESDESDAEYGVIYGAFIEQGPGGEIHYVTVRDGMVVDADTGAVLGVANVSQDKKWYDLE